MQDEAKVKLAEKQTQRSYFKRMRKAILGVCSLWGVHPAPSCTRSAHRHVGRAHVRTREIERRRVEWVTSYLGTSDYKFGDLTQKFVRDITGKEGRVLLADVDHIERTAASLRSRQLFDVSSGASPLLLYDPEAFVDLVRSLRKCFSVDQADHVADKVRWRLARRGRPAPAPYEPPSSLGDVSSMVKRNDHRPSTRV